MIPTTRRPFAGRCGVFAVLLACMLLISGAVTAAAVALVIYQSESYPTYQQQLAGGQIQSVKVYEHARELRITLKDGQRVFAKYPRKGEPQAAAALAAKHVPVTVLSRTAAEQEVAKPAVHHKLRYIAAAIVIALIVIVVAVLLIHRKRRGNLE